MTRVDVTIEIDRPPAAVFAYVCDFENNPDWQSGVESARFTSRGPIDVGSTSVQVASSLGRRVESTFEVSAVEPGTTVRIESAGGTFPIRVTRRVEPAGAGSRVTATIEGSPGGLFRVAEPLLERLMRRRIEADYRRLNAELEA